MLYTFGFFILVLAFLVYGTRTTLILQSRRRSIIRANGCQPIAKYPSLEPFGRDYDRVVKKSFEDGTVNSTAMALYAESGSSTFEVQTVNDRVVNTMDSLNHHAIATNTGDWVKDVRRASFPWSGSNILDQQGAAWRRTRSMVNPLFARAELKDVKYFRRFIDRFIERVPRDGSTIDLQPLIRKMFLDSTTEFVFGESIDSQLDTTGAADAFLATFARAQSGAQKRVLPTGWRLAFNNRFATWDRAWLADCRTIHDYIDACITRHRSSSTKTDPLSDERKRYVLIDGMSAAIPDPVALRFQLLAIFSVGRETSAVAFANLLFLLARSPDVWAHLRRQAMALRLDGDVSYEQLLQLTDFRHAVLEAFRLRSPVTRLRRVAARDCVLPRGGGADGSAPAFVPKGTTIWADRFPGTRDTAVWGEDVESYRPARFEDGRGAEGRAAGFAPFSTGPRICPARQQVVHQCMHLLVRMVCEFEAIENRDPCVEFVERVGSTFESRNGCKVALHPAKKV